MIPILLSLIVPTVALAESFFSHAPKSGPQKKEMVMSALNTVWDAAAKAGKIPPDFAQKKELFIAFTSQLIDTVVTVSAPAAAPAPAVAAQTPFPPAQ